MIVKDIETVRRLAINWGNSWRERSPVCPPGARVVTGKPSLDALFYYFETESGLQLKLSDDHNIITDYDILNAEKFTWFMLRWS